MSVISSYCHISNDAIAVNGDIFSVPEKGTIQDLMKSLYKKLKLDYPKFYKMDVLSKAAFLGVEMMKEQYPAIACYGDDEIAMLFSNSHSSGDTDVQFLESCQKGNSPSPSLFVYTLPNILLGELAIRNQWYGENLFFVSPRFDPDFFASYARIVLSKSVKACMCGWIDVLNEKAEALLFFVEGEGAGRALFPFTGEAIEKIYNQYNYGKSEAGIKETNH